MLGAAVFTSSLDVAMQVSHHVWVLCGSIVTTYLPPRHRLGYKESGIEENWVSMAQQYTSVKTCTIKIPNKLS